MTGGPGGLSWLIGARVPADPALPPKMLCTVCTGEPSNPDVPEAPSAEPSLPRPLETPGGLSRFTCGPWACAEVVHAASTNRIIMPWADRPAQRRGRKRSLSVS